MNREEAGSILSRVLSEYRQKPHSELVALIDLPIILTSSGREGTEYQIEVEVFWDRPGKLGGDLRVLASIEDGGLLTSIHPLSMDFIKSPDRRFIGE